MDNKLNLTADDKEGMIQNELHDIDEDIHDE